MREIQESVEEIKLITCSHVALQSNGSTCVGNSHRKISFIRQSELSMIHHLRMAIYEVYPSNVFDLADYELFSHLRSLSRPIQILAPPLLQPVIARPMVSQRRLLPDVCGLGP